jgi:DNA-directed RNA polymerase subunit RPC12/RpoP
MIFDYRCNKCGIEYEADDRNEPHYCTQCPAEMTKVYGSCNAIINCKGTYKGDNKRC